MRRKHKSLYHSLYRGLAACHNINLYRWEVLCLRYLGEAMRTTGSIPSLITARGALHLA
jgi:hypothetical protein